MGDLTTRFQICYFACLWMNVQAGVMRRVVLYFSLSDFLG
jgi:hypothetical protein